MAVGAAVSMRRHDTAVSERLYLLTTEMCTDVSILYGGV